MKSLCFKTPLNTVSVSGGAGARNLGSAPAQYCLDKTEGGPANLDEAWSMIFEAYASQQDLLPCWDATLVQASGRWKPARRPGGWHR